MGFLRVHVSRRACTGDSFRRLISASSAPTTRFHQLTQVLVARNPARREGLTAKDPKGLLCSRLAVYPDGMVDQEGFLMARIGPCCCKSQGQKSYVIKSTREHLRRSGLGTCSILNMTT